MLRRRFSNLSSKPYNIEDYLSITALEDDFKLRPPASCFYSINGGKWIKSIGDYTEPINTGDFYCFKRTTQEGEIGVFYNIDKACTVGGNVMSLIYGDDAKGKKDLRGCSFRRLFFNARGIKEISKEFLSTTILTPYCYSHMFSGCTSLVNAPELPATILTPYCYSNMFSGCTSLVNAPELPATNLAGSCYSNMFSGCSSLTTAPELPATNLAGSCYYNMFSDCTSLVNAPELPATTLADGCYQYMFYRCTNLSYIKMLATNISPTFCLYKWVDGVSTTGIFVKNKNANWDTTPGTLDTSGVPAGWTVVNDGEEIGVKL